MENLAPSLKFILSIRYSLEGGRSLNLALKEYLKIAKDPFGEFLLKWSLHLDKGTFIDPAKELKSSTQMVLVHLLKRGLEGQSIHPKLVELESEVVDRCRLELGSYIQKLSFRLLIPLLLFQFPAILVLFLGFLMSQVSNGLG